jgi:hypothetical protein
MPTIESLIAGSEKLTNLFGHWPSFHDAEVLEREATSFAGITRWPRCASTRSHGSLL